MSEHSGNGQATVHHVPAGTVRAFSILIGLVLLGVLLQGLWAGEFMGGVGGADWRQMHQITGYVTVILSLVAAVLAMTALRRSGVATWSVALFVLLLVQAGLGQAISDADQRVLIAAHVPVALLIMALGVYLSVAGANLRRRHA